MTTTTLTGDKPILLAFSGGLDTSFCVPWLKETYRRPVITVTVDTGGIDAAAAQSLAVRSVQLGAVEHHLGGGAWTSGGHLHSPALSGSFRG